MLNIKRSMFSNNLLFPGILSIFILVAVAVPASEAKWPKKKYTLIYKVTSHMWDAGQQKAVPTSKEVLDDIHSSFKLWQETSGGTLRFAFGGFGNAGYDSYSQIPYDGEIYLVLNGRYNHHGELANARYSGTIPNEYKKAAIFFNKQTGSYHRNTIIHEIGHVLGLEHAASNASVMFSGEQARGAGKVDRLSEQDDVNLQHLWDPDNKDIFTMSGSIQTTHKHKMAFVFAVNTLNGHTYSTRSDHMGNYTLVLGKPGRYKVVAKAVEVSDDLKALKYQRGIPQRASWYVEDGLSTPDPDRAFPIIMFQGRPHTQGTTLQMLDSPAPFKLTRSVTSQPGAKLHFLQPDDDVMLALPEVNHFESIESFGTEPDYHFSDVPEEFKRKYQAKLHIDKNAPEGERLVLVRDKKGRSQIGLIGIHVSHQPANPVVVGSEALVAQLSFDRNFNDSGPYRMQGQVNGDEVLLRKGIKGKGLFIGGAEDWLDVPLPDQLLLESGFTSEFWFKREDWANPYIEGSGFQTMVAVTSSFVQDITTGTCALTEPWSLVSSLVHRNLKHNESETVRVYTKPNTIQPKTWYHAATVYNPFAGSLTLYLDGKLVETAWGVPAPVFSIRHIRFGTWYKANQAFRGTIDEFKLYNYARTPEEIQTAAQRPR